MSEKIKFYYYNLVDQDATIITPGNENALFPASNLKDARSTKVYRSTTSSDSIVFDFITTESVNSLLVKAHALEGRGFTGTLTFEANATDSWASPAFSTTLSFVDKHNIGIKTLDSAQSYRFWRVTGSGASYFELSNVFIGSYFQPGRNMSRAVSFEERDESIVTTNEYGQRFTTSRPSQKFSGFKINLLDKDEVDLVWDMFDYTGKTKPVWIVFDEGEYFSKEKERFAGFYYFKSRPKDKHVIKGLYNLDFDVEEAV